MPRKRDHITKGTRFAIFERDGFQCQYCGRLVPDVILQLDHIIPHSQGGSDDPDNLITACQACNIGKGAKTVTVQREAQKSLDDLTERREQIAAYYQYQKALEDQLDIETQGALDYFAVHAREWHRMPEEASVRRFIRLLGYRKVVEAIDIALSKHGCQPNRYMFGVLHNWRRQLEEKDG